MRYIGQPAADTGGVMRQCYTDTFDFFLSNWFCGVSGSKIPIYRSDIYVIKVFTILGTIIAHSVCQKGPGLPVLPVSVYKYIISGSTDEAISYVSVDDMGDPVKNSYVQQVSWHYSSLSMRLACGQNMFVCSLKTIVILFI